MKAMKNLRKIAFSCLLLLTLLGLGACEPTKDPEAEIGGMIRAKISGQRNIFSLLGKLDPLYSMQKVTIGGKTYVGEPNNTIIEILKARYSFPDD